MGRKKFLETSKEDFNKAKEQAFRLLKFRARTEKELKDRLEKKFSSEVVQKIIIILKELNYLNDQNFLKEYVEICLKKPWGLKRIFLELRKKGIDESLIEQELNYIKNTYDESKIVEDLALRKIGKLKNIDKLKAKRRIFGYLLRRGFNLEIVQDIISKL